MSRGFVRSRVDHQDREYIPTVPLLSDQEAGFEGM